jgi:predicted peroxiredoxin
MEHLHESTMMQKKNIRHVVEKFRKRGVKIATCKPRTMMSLSCIEEIEAEKNRA